MNNKIIWKKLSYKRGKHKFIEKYRKKKRNKKYNNYKYKNKASIKRIEETFVVPNVFSIFENSEETIKYFSDIIKYLDRINKINNGKKYLIKINMKDAKKYRNWCGNVSFNNNEKYKNKKQNEKRYYVARKFPR